MKNIIFVFFILLLLLLFSGCSEYSPTNDIANNKDNWEIIQSPLTLRYYEVYRYAFGYTTGVINMSEVTKQNMIII